MATYYQCRFRRGDPETIAWIEERGAKIGALVELKTADGERWDVIRQASTKPSCARSRRTIAMRCRRLPADRNKD